MALRGKKPSKIEKRIKLMLFGTEGTGKTTASIQFPRPYIIDTEKGAEQDGYVELMEKAGAAYFSTADYDEIKKEVVALLSEEHDYKTIVIDPITPVYELLVAEGEKIKKIDYGAHYTYANKKMKELMNLLLRLDMNVIVTAHAKNEYGDNMKILRHVPDAYKKFPHLFDLMLECSSQDNTKIAEVKKTRMESFKQFDKFPLSYNEIAKRYGKAILEKDAVKQELASDDQVKELTYLFEVLTIPQATIQKGLDKADSSELKEMPAELIQKWIDSLKGKLELNATKLVVT